MSFAGLVWHAHVSTSSGSGTLRLIWRSAGKALRKGHPLRRLVIVSNRVAIPDKNTTARAGGLEVAVKAALKQKSGVWFGWSGKIATHAKIATTGGCAR